MTPNPASTITFTEYQKRAHIGDVPSSLNLNYMVLGLCSEIGEIAGKVKKVIRDGQPLHTIGPEIGDALFYCAGTLSLLELQPKDVSDDLETLTIEEFQGQILNESAWKTDPIVSATTIVLQLCYKAGLVADDYELEIDGNDTIVFSEKFLDHVNDIWQLLAQLALIIHDDLSVLALQNLDKIVDRRKRGVLTGDGDHR